MSAFRSPNYTQVPNDFFEFARDMSEAETKVTLALIRQTFGFHRKAVKMGIMDLVQESGMAEQSVRNGLAAAEERGTIKRLNPGAQGKAEWELCVDNTPQNIDLPPNGWTPTPQQLDPTPPKFCTTGTVLKKEKKVIKKKGDYFDMLKDAQAGSEKAKQIADVIDRLERGLRTTFKRNTTTETIAKFIIQQEAKGDSLDKFISWVYRDEFNASRSWEYAESPGKIKTRWAVAMDEVDKPQQKKQGKYNQGYISPKPGL